MLIIVTHMLSGNWSVDLQAGSEFGYKLLFVVLLSGVMAVVFQVRAPYIMVQFIYRSIYFFRPWLADWVVLLV